jgi:hypothetical protein
MFTISIENSYTLTLEDFNIFKYYTRLHFSENLNNFDIIKNIL